VISGPRAPRRRLIGLTSLLVFAGLAAGLLAHPTPAIAGNVVILRSRALGQYDVAIAGFEAAYRGQVTRFTIEDTGATLLRARVVALRPDALVAMGLRAALYARDHFPRTPVVYCVVQDPEHNDLGGAWITGVSTVVPHDVELAMFKATAPDIHRLAVFYGRATGGEFARGARAAAAAAGLELVEVPLGDLSELADRAREAAAHADALWMPADPTIAASEPFQFLLKLSLTQRKPLFVFSDALVRAGALAAVIPDYAAAGAQAAQAVRRIQAGERAGDIPVTAVRRTRLVVNEVTARALGRELPLAVRRDGDVLP
jgi:putative ABC transport system substrate-binding protein